MNSPIKVEVHLRIEEHLPVTAVNITQFVLRRQMNAGLNTYSCKASLMLHLLLHAAANIRARALRLIQLHDINLMATRFLPSDWEELLAIKPGGQAL